MCTKHKLEPGEMACGDPGETGDDIRARCGRDMSKAEALQLIAVHAGVKLAKPADVAEIVCIKLGSLDQLREPPTVRGILYKWLKGNGYDGLYNAGNCACKVDGDFIPCEGQCNQCQPGFLIDSDCGYACDCAFHIGPDDCFSRGPSGGAPGPKPEPEPGGGFLDHTLARGAGPRLCGFQNER